jgi:hypothetical protein
MPLNKIQRCILTLAALVLLAATLFPPWFNTYRYGGFAGYKFILNSEEQIRLDCSRLGAEWLCVSLVAGLLLMAFRKGAKP